MPVAGAVAWFLWRKHNAASSTGTAYSGTGTGGNGELQSEIDALQREIDQFYQGGTGTGSTTTTGTTSTGTTGGKGKLTAPKNLHTIKANKTTAHVGWDAVKGATSYEISRSGAGGVSGGHTLKTSRWFTSKLKPGQTYSWQVRALGAGGEKSAWAHGSFTTKK